MRKQCRLSGILAATLALAVAAPVFAQSQGDILWRIGAGYINTDTDRDNLVFEGTELNNFQIDVDNEVSLVTNLTFMATDHLGIELLAAWPFKHDIDGRGALADLGKIGSTKHLPPTLSLQWHFLPNHPAFRPYVGAGINYTIFFDDNVDPATHEALVATANDATGSNFSGGSTGLDIDDSLGLALQVGVDFPISDRWFLNADLRWISIEADAKLTTRTFDVDGSPVTLTSRISPDIDPFVFSATLGLRF